MEVFIYCCRVFSFRTSDYKSRKEEPQRFPPALSCLVHLPWGLCIVSGRLFHYHFTRAAVGEAHDDGTALFARNFSAVHIIVAYYAGGILLHFRVFYSSGQNDNLIIFPRGFRLIECLGFFTHHIDSL